MTTSASDIAVVLSGGSTNLDPNKSLGGDPSSAPVIDNVLNNLFADVTSDQSAAGFTDYRCIYFFNDGTTSIYNVELWIDSITEGGSSIQLGIQSNNEVQQVTITGTPTGGSFTLTYRTHAIFCPFDPNVNTWAATIQNAINALVDGNNNPIFHNVLVVGQLSGPTTTVFQIIFTGLDTQRSIDQFLLQSNSLLPLGLISILISVPQMGAPINTIASEIDVSTTPPGGVGFFAASQISPIVLPVLNPGDGFPLWIQRLTPTGTTALADDTLRLRFRAESLAP